MLEAQLAFFPSWFLPPELPVFNHTVPWDSKFLFCSSLLPSGAYNWSKWVTEALQLQSLKHSLQPYHDWLTGHCQVKALSSLPFFFFGKWMMKWYICFNPSSTHLQLFSGLPVTLAGPTTHPSAAGHQRTLALDGRSSPVAPPPLTLGLTWTIQVRAL